MSYLDRVKELEKQWAGAPDETTIGGEKSEISEISPSQPDALSEHLLSRLRAGSEWLTAQHEAWLNDEPSAATDERFSQSFAAWTEMERSLRMVYGYEGCIFGPGQRCPEDAPVRCDSCISSG